MEDANLIKTVARESAKLNKITLSEKVFMDNPNLMQAISREKVNIGTVCEIFFVNMLMVEYEIALDKQGDFIVNHDMIFEIGGKKKDCHQIKNLLNAYLAVDQIEMGVKNKIPLWLFGFLY